MARLLSASAPACLGIRRPRCAIQIRAAGLTCGGGLEYGPPTERSPGLRQGGAPMKTRTALLAALLAVLLVTIAWAEPLPTAKPEQVGMSSERLERVGQSF